MMNNYHGNYYPFLCGGVPFVPDEKKMLGHDDNLWGTHLISIDGDSFPEDAPEEEAMEEHTHGIHLFN